MEELKAAFESINNVPPPLLLALTLSFVRLFFWKYVPHVWLNVLAMVLGGVVMPLVSENGKVNYDVRSPITYLILQGVMAGGLSILFNGAIQKWLKNRQIGVNDTEIITKDETNEKTIPIDNQRNSSPDRLRD